MSRTWVVILVATVGAVLIGLAIGVFGGHKYWKSSSPPSGAVRLRIQKPTKLEQQLASAYSPLLVFGDFPDDPWRPGPVATYLCQARLVTPAMALADADTPVPATINATPATPCASNRPPHVAACRSSWPLPFAGGTSCVLDLPDCTLREDASCYTKAYPPSSMARPGKPARIDYYTRVIPVSPKVDDDLAGPMRRLSWVFQYWFFYPFDDWGDSALHLRQVHEGDWEFAVVGVAAHGSKPLFVGYSHHCFGGWSWFNDPRLRVVHTGRGTAHPVLYVADGSHAMYTEPGAPNVDLAHCALGVSLRSHLAGIGRLRDHTVPRADARAARAAATHREERTPARPVWIGATSPWAIFDQPWGEGEEIYTPVSGWRVDALGPAGPVFQGVTWTKPVYTILCSGGWTDDSAAGRAASDQLAAQACRASGRQAAPPINAVARSG
jgi:hypothetical protein